MSEEEKAAQVGKAVTAYQEAKIECAHIDLRIEYVFAAYRKAGETMNRNHGTISEPFLRDGRVHFGHIGNVAAEDLLNESSLAVLIGERDAARKRLAATKQAMNDLGISALG